MATVDLETATVTEVDAILKTLSPRKPAHKDLIDFWLDVRNDLTNREGTHDTD